MAKTKSETKKGKETKSAPRRKKVENPSLSELKSVEELYAETFKDISEGSLVKGKVIDITESDVLIDIGYKSEGFVSRQEFASQDIKVGDEVEVLLEAKEDEEGMVVLSREKAERIKGWDKILEAYEAGSTVEGRILRRVKGGFTVDVGMEAFLPLSQVDIIPIGSFDQYVGQTYEFKIVKLNKPRKNVVLSRRALLEESRKEMKKKLLQELKKGEVREGRVKNITDFGAFIDLGGLDGLLHITDMSWGRLSHPSEILAVGETVEVMILDIDRERERVSLGLKQKTPNPWLEVEEKYPVGSKVKGRVVNLANYGAFLELEKGVEGLVHISQMSWTRRVTHPSQVLSVGDVVEAVVLSIDKDNQKISLGLKQLEPDPWTLVEEKYPVGSKVKGKVQNITEYGAFVELEEGLGGMIHISDLSWTDRVNHPSEVLKKGQKVEVVVLEVEPGNKKIALGLKQLTPDPWKQVSEKYKIGMHVKGKVTKVTDFGAFVELEPGVEGLMHISQFSKAYVDKAEKVLSVGDDITAKIIKLDPEAKRIGLSIKEYLEDIEAKGEESDEDSGGDT